MIKMTAYFNVFDLGKLDFYQNYNTLISVLEKKRVMCFLCS